MREPDETEVRALASALTLATPTSAATETYGFPLGCHATPTEPQPKMMRSDPVPPGIPASWLVEL